MKKLENGGQWAQITIFGEDAKILAYLLEKNDAFVGTYEMGPGTVDKVTLKTIVIL